MRTLNSLSLAALLAVSLLGAATAPAAADIQGADKFRVVGLSGTQTLKLMNGPARWAGIQFELPFDARNLRATGVRQGIWVQLSYRADNGSEFTGWGETQYLAADDAGQPTVFRVVNVARRQSVPLLNYDGYGVQAKIPAGTALLPACGPCQNGYCQVRFQTRRGSLEGLVDQAYLAVVRPANPGFAIYEQPNPGYDATADATYGNGYQPAPKAQDDEPAYADAPVDLLPMPEAPRRHGWRHFWERLQGDRIGY